MTITLPEAVRTILSKSSQPLSPTQIKDQIKATYPHLYVTEAHRIGIDRGNYQSFDHALLNPIYSLVSRNSDFLLDRSSKPMLVSLATNDVADEAAEENYESEVGLVYVLSTGMYSEQGKRIVKIGHTTQPLASRIAQLYTTGTPFQFVELHSWRTNNYTELEQALHRLFAPFRINRAREFFTEEVLAFVGAVADIHSAIQMSHRARTGS
jgi:T5orf172 domain